MHFHLTLIFPDPRQHGLLGYTEVMETIAWGLQQLGYGTSTAQNALGGNAANVLFGAQLLHPDNIRQLPGNTVLYNLEQLRGRSREQIPAAYVAAAERQLTIWDYSEQNRDVWRQLGVVPKIVPVSYAPILSRIAKARVQDIDVLFYGLPNPHRTKVFEQLGEAGLRAVFVSGIYGQARDELIGRSKIVLNLNLYAQSRIFEIVRVSYLMANAKAVVSDIYPGSEIPSDLRGAIALAAPEQILSTCVGLLQNDSAREAIEQSALRAIQTRDVRQALRQVLGA